MYDDLLGVGFLALYSIMIWLIGKNIYNNYPDLFYILLILLLVAYYYFTQDDNAENPANIPGAMDAFENFTDTDDNGVVSISKEINRQNNNENNPLSKLTNTNILNQNAKYDIDDPTNNIQELFKESGCSGDNKLANRMKYMGIQSKLATDIRQNFTADKCKHMFEAELDAQESRDWWDENKTLDDKLMETYRDLHSFE